MLWRSLPLLRHFSLPSQLASLSEGLKAGFSHEQLYKATEDCFADPTLLTSDPRVILQYKDTLLEIHRKFGQHSKQLLSGVVHPLLARLSLLPDLPFADSLSLLRFSLSLPTACDSKIVKSCLQPLIRQVHSLSEPLDPTTTLDLYRAMRAWRVLSYELVTELELSQLYQPKSNLFTDNTGLLQIYADFGLSLERVRPRVVAMLIKELKEVADAAAIARIKAVAMTEEFDLKLWQELLFPRMQIIKSHHLAPEMMANLALIYSILELLAPAQIQQSAYLLSEGSIAMRNQAFAAARTRRELKELPVSKFTPATLEDRQAGANKSIGKGLTKYPNELTESLAKALRILNEGFIVNFVTPAPYALYAELLVRENTVIKPLPERSYVHDSFKHMGAARVEIKMLRKLKYQVAEISESDWVVMPKKDAPKQLARIIRAAQEKSSKN